MKAIKQTMRFVLMTVLLTLITCPLASAASKTDPYFIKGLQYQKDGQYDKAIDQFSCALKIEPKRISILNNRGICYMQTNKDELALQDFTAALTLDSKHVSTLNNRSIVYGKLKKFDLAFSDINQAIEYKPNFATSYVNRADLYFQTNNLANALRDSEKALMLDPTSIDAFLITGDILFAQEKYNEALSNYHKAAKLSPTASVYEKMGTTLIRMNKSELGQKCLVHAHELDPSIHVLDPVKTEEKKNEIIPLSESDFTLLGFTTLSDYTDIVAMFGDNYQKSYEVLPFGGKKDAPITKIEYEDILIRYGITNRNTPMLLEITLKNDKYQTPRGIKVGQTEQQILDAYGKPYILAQIPNSDSKNYIYKLGLTPGSLYFHVKKGVIISISLNDWNI